MALDFADLEAEVTRNETVDGSASALINLLADQIDDAAGDIEKLSALTARMRSSTDGLVAAVTANTPSGGGGV